MEKIDRAFVAIGLAWLVLGMLLGLQMGATANNTFLQVHITMLLGGFVVLTFYGVIYRLWPVLMDSPLAKVQFWSAAIGALVMIIGTLPAVIQRGIVVVALGSVLAILGSALMLWIFWTHGREAR